MALWGCRSINSAVNDETWPHAADDANPGLFVTWLNGSVGNWRVGQQWVVIPPKSSAGILETSTFKDFVKAKQRCPCGAQLWNNIERGLTRYCCQRGIATVCQEHDAYCSLHY